jgi:hypothetical protein
MLRTACSALALLALSHPALAAGCTSPNEAAALKTAVIQQELMVAALQCRETGAYNRFVIAYRGELQASDANLKAFFVRRGGEHGEAGYDTFKTKAANLSALQQARNAQAFCADAHALFLAARNHQGSLMSFVETRSGIDVGNICVDSRPLRPVLSGIPVTPEKAPALVRTAGLPAEVAIGGVPDHNMPAIPYRGRDGAAPPWADDIRGPALVRTAAARAPAEVGVPDHNIPAIPYQQDSRDSAAPPPRALARNDAAARDDDAAQGEENDARGSYATASAEEVPPRPRYYGPRYRGDDDRNYVERGYRDQGYYPPSRPMPLSRWEQQGWQWQAWREYPRPRYGLYPRDPYRGW